MKTQYSMLLILMAFLMSSWTSPTTVIYTSTVTIGDKTIITLDNTAKSYSVALNSGSLKDEELLTASMHYPSYRADGATCMVVITNEYGETLHGSENTKGGTYFTASLAMKDILSNEHFKNATVLNVMLSISNAEEKSINELYLLGQIQLQ